MNMSKSVYFSLKHERKEDRKKYKGPMKLYIITMKNKENFCELVDVSFQGFRIRYSGILQVGETLKFKIINKDISAEFNAEVRYCESNLYYGFRLIDKVSYLL